MTILAFIFRIYRAATAQCRTQEIYFRLTGNSRLSLQRVDGYTAPIDTDVMFKPFSRQKL